MNQSTFCTMDTVGGVLVARPQREKVGDYESPILKGEIEKAAPASGWKIVVDLSDVRLVASAGLGVLVSLNSACKKNGGKLAVCGMDENLRQVFEMTKLHRVLTIVGTRDEAVKALG
ncbi:MAG: STAS domain-containing protein [Phycisphaeraceae bacterium]|nr:MAG: STAS domain-containing protein [Phycisphaeraceae bacterium]